MVNQPSAHPVRAELSPQDLFDRHQDVARSIARRNANQITMTFDFTASENDGMAASA